MIKPGQFWCTIKGAASWSSLNQRVVVESTCSRSTSKLLEHLVTQLSIVAVESCKGSFHVDEPLDHLMGCFAISAFQDLESELDFRRVGVSWITKQVDCVRSSFLSTAVGSGTNGSMGFLFVPKSLDTETFMVE